MSNPDKKTNAELIAAQHKYSRDKERADKILKRYDFALKILLGFSFGLGFAPLMMGITLGIPILLVFGLIVFGGAIFGALTIRKRKKAHQATLDAQILGNLEE